MKYFKAVMKMGHCGRGRYREVPVFIYAETLLKAMDRAKNMPGIKHGNLPISVIEITKDEFNKGVAEKEYLKAIEMGAKKIHVEESENLY